MKKRTLSLLCFWTLLLCLTAGCGLAPSPKQEGSQDSSNPSEDKSQTEEETPDSDSQTKKEPETEDAQLETNLPDSDSQTEPDLPDSDSQTEPPKEEELDLTQFAPMEKAMDSLMLSSMEQNCDYNSTDPVYIWFSIYYGIINHTDEISLAEQVEDAIRVPAMAVQEFALGLFSDCGELPPIPEQVSVVSYDQDWDAYLFLPMERGAIKTQILSASSGSDGSARISAALYSKEDNAPLFCAAFTLVENPNIDSISQPMFPYHISAMKRSSAINTNTDQPVLTGSYQGFTDSHTVEFKVDGNLMAFQVYDQDIIAILSITEEGAQVSFASASDESTQARTITSIMGN